MLKKVFLLILCLAIIMPVGVYAQGEVKFAAIEVDLWPEYDRPSMLVIYRITLDPEVTLPAAINIKIPARVGIPNAVAAKQADGGLINIPYETQKSGDWGVIAFQATSPEIQIEYYDPALAMDGQKRSFEYQWPGDYAVDRFTMQIQQPMEAKLMQIAPSFGNGATAPDGFVYYISDIGSISVGQTFAVNLEYEKESDNLSLTDLPVSPSGPIEESPLSTPNLLDILPWILGILGLALLLGGGLWYYQSGRNHNQEQVTRRRNRRKVPQSESSESDEEGFIYCHQCGKRANPGDRFCRACGTQLRK